MKIEFSRMADQMRPVLDSKIDVRVHRSMGNAGTSALFCQHVERAEKSADEHNEIQFNAGSR